MLLPLKLNYKLSKPKAELPRIHFLKSPKGGYKKKVNTSKFTHYDPHFFFVL